MIQHKLGTKDMFLYVVEKDGNVWPKVSEAMHNNMVLFNVKQN